MTSAPPDRPTALGPLFAPSGSDDLSSHAHRLLIGCLGFLLPLSLWLLAGWRPTYPLPQWKLLESVSAYYHTGAVAAFVGVLVSLAMFLFTYRGYGNRHNLGDRICAITSGVSAIGVAFFPTGAPAGLQDPAWWSPWMSVVHYVSAATLFTAFFVFSFFLFPGSKPGSRPDRTKRFRNILYRFCGAAILCCMIWILAGGSRPIFLPETLALGFFSLSWLVKGRADWTLRAMGRKAAHFGRNPGDLVGKGG